MISVAVVGSCLFAYGRRVGELCRRDSDCESGLVCAEAEQGISTRVCRPPVHQDKQYSEPCNMSSECDISRGLCCQLQRRHRQAPRKVSWYGIPRKFRPPAGIQPITITLLYYYHFTTEPQIRTSTRGILFQYVRRICDSSVVKFPSNYHGMLELPGLIPTGYRIFKSFTENHYIKLEPTYEYF